MYSLCLYTLSDRLREIYVQSVSDMCLVLMVGGGGGGDAGVVRDNTNSYIKSKQRANQLSTVLLSKLILHCGPELVPLACLEI